jgi:hypothetical protein
VLTLKQVFAASGLHSGAALVAKFNLRPLSLSSVIDGYEHQRQAYFVKLISPNIFLSDKVHSLEDLKSHADGELGLMTQSEVEALASYLGSRGVFMRFVSKDLRRAVILGDVPALISVPAAPINDGNFISFKDASSGATKAGTGTIALGTVIVTLAVGGPAAIAAGGEVTLLVGASLVVFGAGFLITYGVLELLSDPPAKQPSSENTDVPNDVDGVDTGDVEVPDAVAVGSPDNGIDVQDLVDQIGTGALDEIVSNLPLGWDSDSGTGLSGIGGFDAGNGGNDGDNGGGIPGGGGFGFG